MFVPSLSFYLSNCISSNSWILYSQGYNSFGIIISFVAQIIPTFPIGSSFRLTSVFFWYVLCMCTCYTSLFSGTTRCFRLILYFSCLSPRLISFHKTLISFIGEWYFKVRIWMLGVLVVNEIPLVLDALCGQSQEIYVCLLICVSTHISLLLYVKYNSDSNQVCFDPTGFADGCGM